MKSIDYVRTTLIKYNGTPHYAGYPFRVIGNSCVIYAVYDNIRTSCMYSTSAVNVTLYKSAL